MELPVSLAHMWNKALIKRASPTDQQPMPQAEPTPKRCTCEDTVSDHTMLEQELMI